MRRISRMVVFSAVALYLTAFWNKGFIIQYDYRNFLITALAIALIFYLVLPISRVILIPLNFLTLGLISIIFNIILFYFFQKYFSLIKIESWMFAGLSFKDVVISKVQISQIVNLVLSSASISFIINVLERIL